MSDDGQRRHYVVSSADRAESYTFDEGDLGATGRTAMWEDPWTEESIGVSRDGEPLG